MKDKIFKVICKLFGKKFLDYASRSEIQVVFRGDNDSLRETLEDTEELLSAFENKLKSKYGNGYLEILNLIIEEKKNEKNTNK